LKLRHKHFTSDLNNIYPKEGITGMSSVIKKCKMYLFVLVNLTLKLSICSLVNPIS
jgi:hypothetical protein